MLKNLTVPILAMGVSFQETDGARPRDCGRAVHQASDERKSSSGLRHGSGEQLAAVKSRSPTQNTTSAQSV
jgi:hypothetical protein